MGEEIKDRLCLVNKLVKVVDSANNIDNTGVISLMYPSFLVKDDIFFDYENDVIYTGKYKAGIREELAHGTRNFIAFGNVNPDIDFTDRETIVKVLYNKWDKCPSEQVLGLLVDNMSEQEFWDYFKKFWILGKSNIDDKDASIFELYKVLGKQRNDILKTYFKLREVYSDNMIFMSTLSFLEKALEPSKAESNSGWYQSIVKEFGNAYRDKIYSILKNAYTTKVYTDSDKERRTIVLLMQLGKGSVI